MTSSAFNHLFCVFPFLSYSWREKVQFQVTLWLGRREGPGGDVEAVGSECVERHAGAWETHSTCHSPQAPGPHQSPQEQASRRGLCGLGAGLSGDPVGSQVVPMLVLQEGAHDGMHVPLRRDTSGLIAFLCLPCEDTVRRLPSANQEESPPRGTE